MQRHYSTVGLDEKRAAIAGVLRWRIVATATSVPDAPSQHPRDGGADAVAVHTLLDQELDMDLPRANITG
jgi:hypothetical protein